MVVGAVAGLGLGLVTARYLNSILASFPGLPAAIDFFLFEPRDAWTALGLLAVAGMLAGVYPSWRGASRADRGDAARRGGRDDDAARRRCAISIASITWVSELVHAVRGVTLDVARGDYRRHRRPVGLRQVDAAQSARRHRPAERRQRSTIDGARVDRMRDARSDAISAAAHRIRVSALLSDAGAHGDRERRAADGRGEG